MRQINLFCFFVDFVVPALFFYCSLFLKHFLLLEITALSFGVHRREPLPEVTGGNLSRLWFHWNSEPWGYRWVELDGLLHHHLIIYPLTTRVVGAPQMISQPFFSGFLCSPLPSGTCRTPGLSIPLCCLPTSSCVCLVFFHLSLCLARGVWPSLMNGRYDHTTVVCVSLGWSGCLRVVQLPTGSWHGLFR